MPFNDSVWVYAAELAAEAIRLGFDEVQFDYVRFPDEPRRAGQRRLPGPPRGERPDRASAGGSASSASDPPLGVPFTIDVFGLTTSADGDMGIGQNWEDLVTTADVVLPMVYPSHYRRGEFGFDQPNAKPYAIMRLALTDALARSRSPERGPDPALPSGVHPGTPSAPLHADQRFGSRSAPPRIWGSTPRVLWNPRSVYERGQITPERRPVPVAMAGFRDGTAGANR